MDPVLYAQNSRRPVSPVNQANVAPVGNQAKQPSLAGRPSDSIRFGARTATSSTNTSTEEQPKHSRWETATQTLKTKTAQWKSGAEKNFNWLYKQAVMGVMIAAAFFNGFPMPQFMRNMIERRYFFSPPKVSSIHLIKSRALRQRIVEMVFHPEGLDTPGLTGWYIPAKKKCPTVVFSHGRASNISDLEPLLQALSDKGYGVFAYDYPGFGSSEGTPTEKNLYEAGIAACKYLAGDLEGHDSPFKVVPYHQQILMGHSMGGAVAVDIAKHFADDAKQNDPTKRIFNKQNKPELQGQPQALVVINTFTDLKEALTAKNETMFSPTLQKLFSAKKIQLKFDSKNKIGDVAMPILVMHGDSDVDVLPAIGAELFSNVKEAPRGVFGLLPNVKHKLKDSAVCAQITDNMTQFLAPTPRTAEHIV